MAIAIGGFAASRLLAGLLGVRFDDAPLDYFWQILDPTLLEGDLLASLWHQHTQPPAFNALLGVVLKLDVGEATTRFALLFHAIGLATCVGLFALTTRLGMDAVRAGWLAALYAASPTAVLYEHWLFYTQLVACLLAWGAVAVHSLVRSGRARHAALLSIVVAVVACTRSLFHAAWAVTLLAGALFFVRRAHQQASPLRLALAISPALLLVLGLYAKNAMLFGTPASSTWLGMSLAKTTTWRLEPEQREALIAQGDLSAAARIKPFSPLNQYPREWVAGPPWGHPALDRVVKPGNYTNFNHHAYLRLNELYLDDALVVLRRHPDLWLESMALAGLRYAIPPSQYPFVAANAAAYAPVDRLYQIAAGVPEAISGRRAKEALGDPAYLLRRVRWLYWAAAAYGLGWALVRIRRGRSPSERATLLYCMLNIGWVALLANAVELGENQRFQVMVAPLHFALIGAALDATWRREDAQAEAASASPPSAPA